MWLITVPVPISQQTVSPQELPSVELSALVLIQLAQGANLLAFPVSVTLASGFPSMEVGRRVSVFPSVRFSA